MLAKKLFEHLGRNQKHFQYRIEIEDYIKSELFSNFIIEQITMHAQCLQIPGETPQSITVPVYFGSPSQTICPPPPSSAKLTSSKLSGPLVVNVVPRKSASLTPCPTCGKDTPNVPKKTVGCAAIAWCLTLMIMTAGIGCCYAICSDSCKDVEILCAKCQTSKSKIPATCC